MWRMRSVQVTVTSIRLTPATGESEVTAHERLNVTGTPVTGMPFSGLPVVLIFAAVRLLSSSNLSCARLVAMVVYKPVWLACITVVAPTASPRTAMAKMDIATKTSIRVKPPTLLFSAHKNFFMHGCLFVCHLLFALPAIIVWSPVQLC